jgi:reticulon-4-interacting protein 1, mitochondrial
MIHVLSQSIAIHRSASDVYRYISDMENYVQWFPDILQMRAIDQQPIGTLGKRYDEIARLPNGKEERIIVEVVEAIEDKKLSVEASLSPVLPRFDYVIEAINSQSCVFHWTCNARNTSLQSRLFVMVMRLVLKARLKRALLQLKSRLERTPEQSMDEWVIRRFGSALDVLQMNTMAVRPSPKVDEVLIRVQATSINPIDVRRRAGYGRKLLKLKQAASFPMVLGNDIAGEVVELGDGVTRWKEGDRVFGAKDHGVSGTHAQYCCVAQENLVSIPSHIEFSEAASIPYGYLTAWTALVSNAKLNPNKAQDKKVFIQGGGSNVGLAATRLCKAWGAHVAVSCGATSVQLAKEAGADIVINYQQDDYSKKLSNYDVALCCADIKEESKIISILKRDADAAYVAIDHPTLALTDELGILAGLLKVAKEKKQRARKAKQTGIRYSWCLMKNDPQAMIEISVLLLSKKIKPFIGKVFKFTDLPSAHIAAERSHTNGKIVVTA